MYANDVNFVYLYFVLFDYVQTLNSSSQTKSESLEREINTFRLLTSIFSPFCICMSFVVVRLFGVPAISDGCVVEWRSDRIRRATCP